MKKYIYNPDNLTYKELRWSWKRVFKKICQIFFTLLAVTTVSYTVYALLWDSEQEKEYHLHNKQMEESLMKITKETELIGKVLNRLQQRDTVLYYSIFERSLPSSINEDTRSWEELIHQNLNDLVETTTEHIKRLNASVPYVTETQQSLFELTAPNINNIPMIQPLDDHYLSSLVATFGNRLNPFYKTIKMHYGVDYTIPIGNKVYATADGKVESIKTNFRVHGLTIKIDHGNDYSTFYGHLDRALVNVGQKVKQGDVIALSGNSGKSFGAHLHYEVWKAERPVNPIHYMFGSLTPLKYKALLEFATNIGQTLD